MNAFSFVVRVALCLVLTLGVGPAAEGAAVQGAGLAAVQEAVPEPAPERAAEPTGIEQLDAWLAEAAVDAAAVVGVPPVAVQGGGGVWQMQAFGRVMVVLADPVAGRMRLMVPVQDEHGAGPVLNPAVLTRVMEANFATALDARYALQDGQLWAAFIHPLPTLSREALRSGMLQAVTLAATFGTTYTSSGLQFGGEEAGDPQEDELHDPEVLRPV